MTHVLPGLSRQNLGRELLAGITLVAVAIPINIGCARIAGLPVVAALSPRELDPGGRRR